MASRPSREIAPVDFGVASFVPNEQVESGDLSIVHCTANRALFAAIDGIGHGKIAAEAAQTAAKTLESSADDSLSLIELVQKCHEALRATRGVVLSIASIDFRRNLLTWIGVGNVQGILIRCSGSERTV